MDLVPSRRELFSSETRLARVELGIEVEERETRGVRWRGNEEPRIPHHELPAKQASDSSGF